MDPTEISEILTRHGKNCARLRAERLDKQAMVWIRMGWILSDLTIYTFIENPDWDFVGPKEKD